MRNRRAGGRPAAFVLATVRRHAVAELTSRKRSELRELAKAMTIAREQYLREYWAPRFAMATVSAPRRLVEMRRRSGWASPQLSPHLNKAAMETALAIVRSSWQTARGRLRSATLKNAALSRLERDYRLRLLDDPMLFQRCLNGDPIHGPSELGPTASRSLQRKVARLAARMRGRYPRKPSTMWFDIDTNLYRAFRRPEDRYFRGAWLALTSLTKGRRIFIPLRGSDIGEFASRTGRPESRPSLRVYVGETIEFETAKRLPPRASGHEVVGIDLGFNALIVASTGSAQDAERYGGDARTRSAITDVAAERQRQRQRLRALERSIRASSTRKARHIRRRNLGGVRVKRSARRERRLLRDEANRSLNELFARHQLAKIVHEGLAFSSFRLRRRTNRRLARWLWGFLRKRLTYKAELNGVELQVVGAAFTSQSCPHCWFTSSKNRRGERFQCVDCGYAGSADAVAATNVLRRGSDPALMGLMAPGAIRQILDARWRSARSGRAWGSNECAPELDVQPESRTGKSREEPWELTAHAGPYGPALSTGP